jgi:hypothetical protein
MPDTNSGANIMVGGEIPPDQSYHLGLVCAFLDVSRADIVRALIDSFITEQKSVAGLKESIAHNIYIAWTEKQIPLNEKTRTAKLNSFLKDVREHLKYRRVCLVDINTVVNMATFKIKHLKEHK